MTWNIENQRPRELLGIRRTSGVQVDDIVVEKDYTVDLPLESDMRLDFSSPLKSLIVRAGDSTNLTGGHVSYAGLSLSREHASQSPGGTLSYLDESDNAVLPPMEKYSINTAARYATVRSDLTTSLRWHPVWDNGPSDAHYRSLNIMADGNQTTLPLHILPAAAQFDDFIVIGNTDAATLKDNAALAQLILTGRYGGGNSRKVGMTIWALGNDAGSGVSNNYQVLSPVQRVADGASWSGAATANIDDLWDRIALKLVDSSAASFLLRWQQEFEQLPTALVHLTSDMVGFWEKGFRGRFWSAMDPKSIMLMSWLSQLGAYIRTGYFIDNCHVPNTYNIGDGDTDSLTWPSTISTWNVTPHAGAYNPFFLRVRNYDGAGNTREWMPEWVAKLADNANFAYDQTEKPIYGVNHEDIMNGYNAFMNAVSYEMGIMTRSSSEQHLDFFTNFKTAEVPDFFSNDARTDLTVLRTLQMLGMADVEEYMSPASISNLARRQQVSYFREFFAENVLNNSKRDEHIMDIAELEKAQFFTGAQFKEGQQLLGDASFSVYHRQTKDGDSHSIGVNVRPVINWRILNSSIFLGDLTDAPPSGGKHNPITHTAITSGALDGTNAAAFTGTVGPNSMISFLGPWYESGLGIKWIGFPSTKTGWECLDYKATHALNHAWGTDHLKTSAYAYGYADGFGFGYGASCYPDGTVAQLDVTATVCNTPIYPEVFFKPGRNNPLFHLFRGFTRVMKSWKDRENTLPYKSQWKAIELTSINLVAEMTMRTGEALLQTHFPMIGLMTHCAANGGFSIAGRYVNRRLDDMTVHDRPVRYAAAGGADYMSWILPERLVPANPLETIAMSNWLNYHLGLLRRRIDVHADNVIKLSSGAVDTAYDTGTALNNEYHLVYFNGSGGTQRVSNVLRTFYVSQRMLGDGEHRLYSNASMFTHPNDNFGSVTTARNVGKPMYDFVTESVVAGLPATLNGASIYPGLLSVWNTFTTLDATAAGSGTNSLCAQSGLRSTPHVDGSNVATLLGHGKQPTEITTYLSTVAQNADQLGTSDYIITSSEASAATLWDTSLWRLYIEQRGGEEDNLWIRDKPSAILVDQDILDLDRAIFGALLMKSTRQLLLGYTPRVIVIDSEGNEKFLAEDVYMTSSGGGVSTSKGEFSSPDGDDSRDGDARTESPASELPDSDDES